MIFITDFLAQIIRINAMVLNQIQSVYSDVSVVPCSADFLLEVKTGPVVIKKGVGEC